MITFKGKDSLFLSKVVNEELFRQHDEINNSTFGNSTFLCVTGYVIANFESSKFTKLKTNILVLEKPFNGSSRTLW